MEIVINVIRKYPLKSSRFIERGVEIYTETFSTDATPFLFSKRYWRIKL
tara:strand:- start:268 stop:414 length:147 start_codon:yes stop_codon:yes gene_type:complete